MLPIFVLLLIVVCSACPDGCTCEWKSIKCDSLSQEETDNLYQTLKSAPFDATEVLHIKSTKWFSIANLPEIPTLKELSIQNGTANNEWSKEARRFVSVTKLSINDCNMTTFMRNLIFVFPGVEELDLSRNSIGSLGTDSIHLAQVRKLTLQDNQIESLGVHILRYMPQLLELNLSGNRLTKLVTSDFSAAIALRTLNVSRNNIRAIECDTSIHFPTIEQFDVSQNDLSELPAEGLQNMEQIVMLNISRNPIRTVPQAALRLQNLQVLDLSSCALGLIESGAFAYLPHLHTLDISQNQFLTSISPHSFLNNSILFSLNIANTGLHRIPSTILSHISRINMRGMRIDCGCILEDMDYLGTTTIVDWDQSTCITRRGAVHKLNELTKSALSPEDKCRPELLIPFGEHQIATVGDTFNIYCSSNLEDGEMYWVTPSREKIMAKLPEINQPSTQMDYFTSSLFDPAQSSKKINRTHATTEYFRIDVVLESDQGVYECVSKKDGKTISRKIQLVVETPNIYLNSTHVGVTSVHLAWNKNLLVKAVDRVALLVATSSGVDFRREVQLSLYNIYCSYNLINLSPDKDYNICLKWILTDSKAEIFSTCATEHTKPVQSIMETMGIELFILFSVVSFAICCFCCGSCLHARFSISTIAKRESKMAQSVSGQSMLSRSMSSTDSTMYENFRLQTSPSLEQSV